VAAVEDITRCVAGLIPYRQTKDKTLVYLQLRDMDAKRLPNYFGFWGGGIETGEGPVKAMLREIMEELEYSPKKYGYLGKYIFPEVIMYLFYEEVSCDFERKIVVHEGQCGVWFDADGIEDEPRMMERDKTILRELFRKLQLGSLCVKITRN
jgi:8-oxo-dGTP pyrophosphatase MutT (NUDIX family)